MIYLIDDNQADQRKANYSISFVDDGTFSDILITIDKIPSDGDKSKLDHLLFLNEAKCILIHSTTEGVDENNEFIKGDNSNVIKIKESISVFGEQIPLVLFSNGMGNVVFDYKKSPYFLQEIKKNDFYVRLYDFLEHFNNTGAVELRILAYGKNFIQYELEKMSENILIGIAGKGEDDILKITDIAPLSDFRDFISAANLGLTTDQIIERIEDNPITVGKFRYNINSINESYTKHGKNLHNWI